MDKSQIYAVLTAPSLNGSPASINWGITIRKKFATSISELGLEGIEKEILKYSVADDFSGLVDKKNLSGSGRRFIEHVVMTISKWVGASEWVKIRSEPTGDIIKKAYYATIDRLKTNNQKI